MPTVPPGVWLQVVCVDSEEELLLAWRQFLVEVSNSRAASMRGPRAYSYFAERSGHPAGLQLVPVRLALHDVSNPLPLSLVPAVRVSSRLLDTGTEPRCCASTSSSSLVRQVLASFHVSLTRSCVALAGRMRTEQSTMQDKTFSSKAFGTHTSQRVSMPGRVQIDLYRFIQKEVPSVPSASPWCLLLC